MESKLAYDWQEIKSIDALDSAIKTLLSCNDALPESDLGDKYRLPADVTERLMQVRNTMRWLQSYHAGCKLSAILKEADN